MDLSRRTENRRLQARALIWHGLTICNTSPNSSDAAREICDQAGNLLKNEVQDHIWEDLQTLKSKVLRGGSLDATLQAWSQGVVGDRSFQQLTEDFADVIIPRIWDHEGRKGGQVVARRAFGLARRKSAACWRASLHGSMSRPLEGLRVLDFSHAPGRSLLHSVAGGLWRLDL